MITSGWARAAICGLLLVGAACSKQRTVDAPSMGVHEVCPGGDPTSPWVLLIDDMQRRDKQGRVLETRVRRLRSLDVRTGQLGEPFTWEMRSSFESSRYCRGGARSRVWIWTDETGLHQREVATGKIAVTNAQLVQLAGEGASYEYHRESQGLIVTTQFKDKVLVDVAVQTKHELPASARGESSIWISGHHTNLEPCPPFPAGHAFSCEGSRCRLSASSTAGRGGPPLPGADTLLVATTLGMTPDREGLLAVHLGALDEATRRISRLTLAGKVVWTLPHVTDIWPWVLRLGGEPAEAPPPASAPTSGPATPPADRADLLIVTKGRVRRVAQATGAVRWELQHPEMDNLSFVMRVGDVLLLARKTSLVGLTPGGRTLWMKQL